MKRAIYICTEVDIIPGRKSMHYSEQQIKATADSMTKVHLKQISTVESFFSDKDFSYSCLESNSVLYITNDSIAS